MLAAAEAAARLDAEGRQKKNLIHTHMAFNMIISRNEFATDEARVPQAFDYIVCGAGSAGCAVAGRLSEGGAAKVLVLEAGGNDTSDIISDPNSWPLTLGTGLDWQFVAEQSTRLEGRAIRMPWERS